MPRSRNSVATRHRRKKVLKMAKGYKGPKSKRYKAANEQVMHSLQYAYRDRRAKKGDFRRLWITRINAAAREHGMSYNKFISGLREAGVEVDRKILAEIAISDPEAFKELVDIAGEKDPGKAVASPSAASKPSAQKAAPKSKDAEETDKTTESVGSGDDENSTE